MVFKIEHLRPFQGEAESQVSVCRPVWNQSRQIPALAGQAEVIFAMRAIAGCGDWQTRLPVLPCDGSRGWKPVVHRLAAAGVLRIDKPAADTPPPPPAPVPAKPRRNSSSHPKPSRAWNNSGQKAHETNPHSNMPPPRRTRVACSWPSARLSPWPLLRWRTLALDQPGPRRPPVDWDAVEEILVSRCVACHGADEPQRRVAPAHARRADARRRHRLG